jgi:hypothetical protein
MEHLKEQRIHDYLAGFGAEMDSCIQFCTANGVGFWGRCFPMEFGSGRRTMVVLYTAG